MHGGAADRSGLIHVGDEVVEVNGLNVEGKTPADVLNILVRHITLVEGLLRLLIFLSKTPKALLLLNWYPLMEK